jgi:hypothetical protein
MREDDAARFSFASEFVKGRVGAVKSDMAALDAELIRLTKDQGTVDLKSGTRNDFMKGLSRKLDMTVTGFNAFRTDPQLKQIRIDLAERAERVSFLDTKGQTYTCPDAQLQTALRGVVRAIEQLPELEKPKVAAVEGSEATIEAFRRLTATFYGALSLKLPPSADELRTLQQKAVQSVEGGQAAAARQAAALAEQAGLSKRDYIPLAIAVFVDLCLLLVSMGRPVNRLHGLVPKMRAAERGPVYQILSKFSDIHRDEETREKFEIFRHVVFDFNGDYYVAVPLDAPYRMRGKRGEAGRTKEYTREVADLQLEAHLLANLFSSFEKERIFTRVYSPFLTTGAIQRKLWRQGSKFAGSEAFRVYRFKDGAWSEIILGAVMGAARRVEAEKRRRRREEGHALPVPTAGAAPAEEAQVRDLYAPAAEPAPHGRSGYAFGGMHDGRRSARASGRRGPAEAPHEPTADPAALAQKFGPYAHSVAGEVGDAPDPYERPRAAPSANYREMAAALASVNAARQQVREAEVSVRAANNNTMPPAEPPLAPNVVMMPRVVTQRLAEEPVAPPPAQAAVAEPMPPVAPPTMPGMIDVTVRRETATFSVPVSEARLPQALAGLAGRIEAAADVRPTEVVTEAAAPSVIALPAPAAADDTVPPPRRYAGEPAE